MFFNVAPMLSMSHLKYPITRDILNHCKFSVIAVIRSCHASYTQNSSQKLFRESIFTPFPNIRILINMSNKYYGRCQSQDIVIKTLDIKLDLVGVKIHLFYTIWEIGATVPKEKDWQLAFRQICLYVLIFSTFSTT